MGCSILRNKKGEIVFFCGEENKPNPCKECIVEAEFLCDFPVGEDKTCDAKLCIEHSFEVGLNTHYCKHHYDEFKKFEESGGVREYLQNNILPFRGEHGNA